MKLAFFGSSEFSIYVLEELKVGNTLPELIITTPDKPTGRKLVLTPNRVKIWAKENGITVIDPPSLKKDNDTLIATLKNQNFDLFLVASYGKIIPKEIFEIPKNNTLNIHPSLLPKYRGASPIQSQILENDSEIGVSIMQIEETMDTGPMVIQNKIDLNENEWPMGRIQLEEKMAKEGAKLFLQILEKWLTKTINLTTQNESEATYCQKISKDDGLINLSDDPYKNLLKIKALEGWPGTFFYTQRNGQDNIRIIIKDAKIENGSLKILRVIPEGKKEMAYEDFLRGQR